MYNTLAESTEAMSIVVCGMVSKSNLLQYVIIGSVFIAAGAIVDLFLAEDEIGRIHARLRNWAKTLRETPLRQRQVAIARCGDTLILSLLGYFDSFMLTIFSKTELIKHRIIAVIA